MDRTEKIIAAIMIAAVAVIVTVVPPRSVDAVNYFPNAEQSLAAIVPEMPSASCKNIAMSSLTPTLVASGSALHLRGSYDVSAADDECWCVMTSAETAATGTGRHFPKGAVIPLRFPSLYLKCSCDGAAIMTVCPNN